MNQVTGRGLSATAASLTGKETVLAQTLPEPHARILAQSLRGPSLSHTNAHPQTAVAIEEPERNRPYGSAVNACTITWR